jgi:O-Antigen ligase
MKDIYIPESLEKSLENSTDSALFRGLWLQWRVLTHVEKVVCLGIILVPLWWIVGWGVMLLVWVVGIAIYEIRSLQRIRLSHPSLEVIAILLFAVSSTISYISNATEFTPRALINPFLMWGCGGLLLWYIQSHKIRVRLPVVAWAFSFTICMMLVWWLFCRFILLEPYYVPPRTIYAVITGQGTYNPAKFGSVGNYLLPYVFAEKGFGGLYRYTFFFTHPTITSFAIGFAALIVLDIKNRLWSLPIVAICSVLIIIAQARNAWLALPLILIVRWLFIAGKSRGLTFVLSLLAITSFSTLCLPSVTDWISETHTTTVEATSNFRKDSTEGRYLIYQRTWESIVEEPSFLGRGVNGPSVQPGYEFAAIGTESFILGTLLYKSGFLGTGLFIVFLKSFVTWLYNTRADRPSCCFLILLYFALVSPVTEFEIPVVFITLISVMLAKSNKYSFV